VTVTIFGVIVTPPSNAGAGRHKVNSRIDIQVKASDNQLWKKEMPLR